MSQELKIEKTTLRGMTWKERTALNDLGYTTQNDIKGLSKEQRTKIINEQIRNPKEKIINTDKNNFEKYKKEVKRINELIKTRNHLHTVYGEKDSYSPVSNITRLDKQIAKEKTRLEKIGITDYSITSFENYPKTNVPVKLNKHGKVTIKGFEEKNDVTDGVFLKPSNYTGENKEMATDLLLKIRGIR